MIRVPALELKVPGSNPGSYFFTFFAHAFFLRIQSFFCAISTHASTQKANLRKICKRYNVRKFDAHSAHVVVLRRYCAK